MNNRQDASKQQDISRRQQVREKRHRQQQTNRLLVIGGIVLVALIVVGLMVASTAKRAVGTVLTPVPVSRPQTRLNTMGDPNAPVKIVEYADFQCPFCMHFSRDTEAQIIEAYVKTGKVYFEYHPVVIISEESQRAAEAALCGGDQEKFWEMHDIIYANQGAERSGALADYRLQAFASDYVKLDMTPFNACFDSGKYKTQVNDAVQDAVKNIHTAINFQAIVEKEGYPADGLSTPTFMVNNTMVAGAKTFAEFQPIIEAALAAAGK